MRPTTKMYLARSAVKRDSRGRYTNEGGGDYRAEGGRGGSMGGEMRSRGENMNNRSRNYGDGYGGEARGYGGNQRNEMTYGGEMYEEEDYRPHSEKRIGFQSMDNNAENQRHNNVIDYNRYGLSHKKDFTAEDAEEWTRAMQNEDGTKGPHWTKEQIKQVMAQTGVSGVEPVEFWAVMNAMYSDYCKVAKKYNLDRPEFYAELAKAFLNDKDAVDDKAAAYFNYIVKR